MKIHVNSLASFELIKSNKANFLELTLSHNISQLDLSSLLVEKEFNLSFKYVNFFKNNDTYKFKNFIFTKETLKEGLILCAKDQLFLFNNEVWLQIYGNSMGSTFG